jgi:hypothetical protein
MFDVGPAFAGKESEQGRRHRMPPNQETPVNTLKKLALAAGLCAAGFTSHDAFAQTTDGYHTIQIFPVVVDTASFTQRFTFRNSNATSITIQPRYYPAETTSQGTPFNCPSFAVAANTVVGFATLRAMCPALAGGSQFGFLRVYETHSANLPFAAYSRVSNAAGAGFSVEAFPANTFTSADAVAIGLRNLAASGGSPAYQTNCFIGNMSEHSATTGVSTNIGYTLYSSTGVSLGSGSVNHTPGKMTRILDIFASVGAVGNHDNAMIQFHETGTGEPGLITFCTVQDNTSFGADFRIAKQEEGIDGPYAGIGSQDHLTTRDSYVGSDVKMPGDVSARTYAIPAGLSRNTHVVYFRHPDWVSCEIINPSTGVRALSTYGLEMRMADAEGALVAGGDEIYGISTFFTGDKAAHNTGSNGRFTIEVESAGTNSANNRPYQLHCESGSGHTLGDMVKSGSSDVF